MGEVVLPDTDEGTTHWADCWHVHQRCAAIRVAQLARCVRIQRSALAVIAEFTTDPKVDQLARKALDEARW